MRRALTLLAFASRVLTVCAEETPTLENRIRVILKADTLADQHEAISRLYRSFSNDEIADLKSHPNDTIAMTAAWHEVLESIPERTKPEVAPRAGGTFEPTALERFLGFAEGRLRTRIPKVWQDSLRHTRVAGPVHRFIPDFEYWPQHKTEAGFLSSLSIHAWKPDVETIEVSLRGDDFQIPSEFLPQQPISDTSIAVALNNDVCVCAFPGAVGFSYTLFCINRTDASTAWKATVFNAFSGGGATGLGHQSRTLIRIQNNRVIVFGACLAGSYVEAFSLKNGKPLCRFSTSIYE